MSSTWVSVMCWVCWKSILLVSSRSDSRSLSARVRLIGTCGWVSNGMGLDLYSVISALRACIWNWIALLTGRLWLRRRASLPASFYNTRGRSRDIFRGVDQGGDGRVRCLQSLRGSVWWGSKTELEQIGFPANETVARDAGNFSRGFLSNRWRERRVLFENVGAALERDNMQLQSIALSTTGYLRSSTPYYPHGAPIFPKPPTK